MMLNIILKNNSGIIKEYLLKKESISIGRDRKGDIFIDDITVSHNHCLIKKEGNAYTVEDMNSTNGTFFNNEKIKKHTLKSGDEIKVSGYFIRILILNIDIRNARLDVLENPYDERKSFDLNRLTTFIGAKSHIPVKPKNQFMIISNRTAAVSIRENRYCLIPVNPELIKYNSETVKNPVELKDSDIIESGTTKLIFRYTE